jgi:Flp pilus assembly secretin CpaC
MINFSLPGLAFAVALMSFAGPALAANDVTLYTDQAKILQITGRPGTIIIGNPSIADITVQGERIVLMGRSYGTTNIIILDRDGGQLAALDVTVQIGDKNAVQVFRAGGRMTLVCAPVCEQTVQVGDDPGRFEAVVKQIITKNAVAGGEAKAAQ